MDTKSHTTNGLRHGWVTDLVIGCFYRVYDQLGFGFLEIVYKNALAIELRKVRVAFEREVPVKVWYGDECIGLFKADFVVEGLVIVEVKASQALGESDQKQLLNYLRCSTVEVGLLMHFGPKASFKRLLYTSDRKPGLTDKHRHVPAQ